MTTVTWNNKQQKATTVFTENSKELKKFRITRVKGLVEMCINGCSSMEDIENHYNDTLVFKNIKYNGQYYYDKKEMKAAKQHIEKCVEQQILKFGYALQWDGLIYEDFSSMAPLVGMSRTTIQKYLKMGINTTDSKLAFQRLKNTKPTKPLTPVSEQQKERFGYALTWDGVYYKNFKDIIKATGFGYATIRKYLEYGINTTDKLNDYKIETRCNNRDVFIWNGKSYPDIFTAAKKLNLSVGALNYRKLKGYTKDSDMNNSCQSIPVKFGGKHYSGISRAILDNAHKYSVSYIRKNCVRTDDNQLTLAL